MIQTIKGILQVMHDSIITGAWFYSGPQRLKIEFYIHNGGKAAEDHEEKEKLQGANPL
jgi:hypothetical protein